MVMRLIPVLTGNSVVRVVNLHSIAVNPRAYGEQRVVRANLIRIRG